MGQIQNAVPSTLPIDFLVSPFTTHHPARQDTLVDPALLMDPHDIFLFDEDLLPTFVDHYKIAVFLLPTEARLR